MAILRRKISDIAIVACAAFFMALFVLPGRSSALNLGALTKIESMSTSPGSTAVFELLLWTTDKAPFNVSLESDAPKDWTAMFSPKQLALPASKGEEFIYVSSAGSVPAAIEKIVVNVPEDAKPGNYSIGVNIIPLLESNFSISILPRISRTLNVQVVTSQNTQENANPAGQYNNAAVSLTHPDARPEGVPFAVILLIISAVFAVSYIIYKI